MMKLSMTKISLPSKLGLVKDIIGGTPRISKRGVPHLIIGGSGVYGSVCYFKKTHVWKFFYPYPSDIQTVKTFQDLVDLIEFIQGGEWWRNEMKERLHYSGG